MVLSCARALNNFMGFFVCFVFQILAREGFFPSVLGNG